MRSNTVVVTPASTLPITLDDVKLWLRVDHSVENDLITSLINAANTRIETLTGRCLVEVAFQANFDDFPTNRKEVTLEKGPVKAVSEVSYIDTDGDSQTTTDYTLDSKSNPARVIFDDVISLSSDAGTKLSVSFTAGYTNIPDDLLLALRHLVTESYHNRGISVEKSLDEYPESFQALVAPYVIYGQDYYGVDDA